MPAIHEIDSFSRLLSQHPVLSRGENNALAVEFIAKQAVVSRVLAGMLYPVEIMMRKLEAGELQYFRERSNSTSRFTGISPSHAKEFEEKICLYRSHKMAQEEFETWLHGFLCSFTYEVIISISAFSKDFDVGEGGGVRGKQLRAALAEALFEANEIQTKMIVGNYKLVMSEVKSPKTQTKMRGAVQARLSEDDLFSIGVQKGLTPAVNRFDPKQGAFSTYATWWIQQAIDRVIKENLFVYRIPLGLQDQLVKSGPNDKLEVRKGCNKDVFLPSETSINAPLKEQKMGADSAETLSGILPDNSAEMPHETVSMEELKTAVAEGVSGMDSPTQLILSLRYGLGDACKLGYQQYLEEVDQSELRAKKTAAAAVASLKRPARMRLKEEQPIPERLLVR
jgi:RNA polymerase sigma factor (sigma-70 family)